MQYVPDESLWTSEQLSYNRTCLARHNKFGQQSYRKVPEDTTL
jgi:hypothetical protein